MTAFPYERTLAGNGLHLLTGEQSVCLLSDKSPLHVASSNAAEYLLSIAVSDSEFAS